MTDKLTEAMCDYCATATPGTFNSDMCQCASEAARPPLSDDLERLQNAAASADRGEGISLTGLPRDERRELLSGLSDDKLSGLVAQLRDFCIDWGGEPIVDDSTPRVEISCGTIRAAANELEALQQQLRVRDELWAKFAENTGLEISWGELDNDPSECGWRVHARFGGVNDGEWDLVATGSTPLEAIRKALSTPEGSDR